MLEKIKKIINRFLGCSLVDFQGETSKWVKAHTSTHRSLTPKGDFISLKPIVPQNSHKRTYMSGRGMEPIPTSNDNPITSLQAIFTMHMNQLSFAKIVPNTQQRL